MQAEEKRYCPLFDTDNGVSARRPDGSGGNVAIAEFSVSNGCGLEAGMATLRAASRLSYALWDTMPDSGSMAAAHAENVIHAGTVENMARRMLRDPRAHKALDEYVSEWLRFDRVLNSSRDRRRYPKFSRETAVAMTEEARSSLPTWSGTTAISWKPSGRLRLRQCRPGQHLRRTSTREGVRPGHLSRGLRASRSAGSDAVPGAVVEAGRHFVNRAWIVRAGTVSLPARTSAAGRSEHKSPSQYRGASPSEPGADVGARDQRHLRHLP